MDALPALCAALVGAAVLVYALVGGLDLGVGLLSLIAPRAGDRDAMLRSIAPLWYGSSVWLALGAFVLAAAFPAGVSFLGAVWPWLALMLAALDVRGTAYALRGRMGAAGRALGRAYDAAFGLTSGLAILCQGLVLGAALSGVPENGGVFGLALVLGLICVVGLVGLYGLLGAGWLVWRAPGAAGTFGREVGHAAVILTTGSVALACGWAALVGAPVAARWMVLPGAAIPFALLAAVLGLVVSTWHNLWPRSRDRPELDSATLARAAGLCLVVAAGLAASLWPAVAPDTDLPGAARGRMALQFTLFDAGLAAPVLLAWVVHAVRLVRAAPVTNIEARAPQQSHVGRRTATLHENELHLS